jgi:hypothetical protein
MPLLMVLITSAFIHIWNPIGFPTVHVDEGTYMRRALHILEGLGLKEELWGYDHPFFGPLFLASTLSIIGYPDSLNPDLTRKDSFHSLYMVPRLIMGILAVIDTFLVYRIGEVKYGRKVALISAILFSVMPLTWVLRRIYLESILLPFMLSSILFAIKNQEGAVGVRLRTRSRCYQMDSNALHSCTFQILISGIFLGLAIFTKIPIVAMIPLVAYLVYKSNKSLRLVGLWFVPVILIPTIWPLHAAIVGELEEWFSGISWQLSRINNSFSDSLHSIFLIDPALSILGAIGFAFALYKRDFLIILWMVPIMVLFGVLLDYINWFHWVPIQPALCLAAAHFMGRLQFTSKASKNFQRITGVLFVAIVIFGLIGTGSLITIDLSAFQFEAFSLVGTQLANRTGVPDQVSNNGSQVKHLSEGGHLLEGLDNFDTTIISSPIYSWVFKYVFSYGDYVHDSYLENKSVESDQVVLIVDRYFRDYLMSGYQTYQSGNTKSPSDFVKLTQIDERAKILAVFEGKTYLYNRFNYPYSSLTFNFGGSPIQVKVH